MVPTAKIEYFDPNVRLELDRLRLKVAELWRAPRLDEKALSHAYARILMIVKVLGEAGSGNVAILERRKSQIFSADR